MSSFRFAVTFGVTVAVAGSSFLLYFHFARRRYARNRTPNESDWKYAGTLNEIIMYPIKSCGGIELNEAKCMKYGLEYGSFRNKILILVDDEDRVGFAGSRPEMWKIKSKILEDDELEVTAPSMEPLFINFAQLIKGRKEVLKCVENLQIPLIECDQQYGSWFSKFLLGKDSGMRMFVCITPKPKKRFLRKNVDLSPFMAISDKSVSDLNARLTDKVHHWQFRGNFLINTHLPTFAEDNWKWMRIGKDAIFRYKAPCYRCILPNINPFTCDRSADFEPLRTLKRYRMRAGQVEPEMGIYFDLHTEGIVKRGDPVYVIA